MVMVCFFGLKKDSFRVGTAVLPKFFFEDVGLEAFEVLQRAGKKVGVSNLPRVMIESFLKDYLEIDVVVGKELKVFCGYFLGLMEEKENNVLPVLEEPNGEDMGFDIIGITASNKFHDHQLFYYCKDVYLVGNSDKRSSKKLPRDRYPKKLVFHDGSNLQNLVGISLPYGVSFPILHFSGLRLTVNDNTKRERQSINSHCSLPNDKPKGVLYVCNHRTLLDPLYICFALKKNLHAVTYSLSKMSEILSPIKTVRLTRNRHQDAEMMERLMNQGDVVVCPEGTTCREPYLLRFSPLFSEISDEIVPVAVDTHVTMFHGTTAGGLKCLDPLFFMMNPSAIYTVQLLDTVSGLSCCRDGSRSSIDVANYVQGEVGRALGFECTKFTRRDKYLILAGNEGIACKSNQPFKFE
ncbi:putative glycerol-3-phosphate acyltransferase 3 [Prunus yedoensis var. nudiflora]|uniref:Putative glycerol-3-phosphate acyltransferase 3 n=1 Tax=Prunus yedoensis var. nudiflora TaxID=2094558 RepID=A0A314YEK7_PRUYE|nr:putative glycerol-3-phosphate acyltransferase 3 [Prunus yedoensis var. nudiflora]